jgi:hypothetical protein
MLSASVSDIDLYRTWRNSEDLDVNWLLRRLRKEEPPTPAMEAGTAFHQILEKPDFEEQTELFTVLNGQEYWFSIVCDIEITLPRIRELRVEKQYGDLLVRGRVDGLEALTVTDYKTTGQFDPDRLMEGYQWRFYLDTLKCDTFIWKVFVIDQFGKPGHYDVKQFHGLKQHRYAGMGEDCQRLAAEYLQFTQEIGFVKEKEVAA